MKIIGRTEKGEYLISASQNEIFEVCGESMLDYRDDDKLTSAQLAVKKYKNHQRDLVGLEIPISSLYHAAKATAREWDRHHPLSEAIEKLRSFANEAEQIGKLYNIQVKA